MSEPSESVLTGDEVQSSRNGFLQILTCASPGPPQNTFQFGERLFNRREIRRVGGQEQKTTSSCFNSLPHTRPQVNREIIQDHDLSSLETGSKDLLNVEFKSDAISRSIQHKRGSHASQRQAGDQGHGGSIIARDLADRSLPSGGVSIQRGHGNVGAGLIHKDQIATVQVASCRAPGSPLCFFLLACSQGFFFVSSPEPVWHA
jgi:hypothetical protein